MLMGHHYVPQEYLRAFQCPGKPGEIWLYDKRDRMTRTVPIRNVAQSPAFYDEDVERKLADVEGPAHGALQRVLSSSAGMTPPDREWLAVYVAIMLYRSPRNRRKNFERIPEVREKVLSEARDAIEHWASTRPDGDPLVARRRRELEEATRKFEAHPPQEVLDQVRSPWPGEEVLRLVSQKTWRLITVTGSASFVTSDSPAVFFEGLGLKNPDSELILPLSPNVALVADHKGVAGSTLMFGAKPALVREVNRRVIADCERFVFAATPQAWVSKVAHKTRPYLSRIQWTA
jgi:hypothetical protein